MRVHSEAAIRSELRLSKESSGLLRFPRLHGLQRRTLRAEKHSAYPQVNRAMSHLIFGWGWEDLELVIIGPQASKQLVFCRDCDRHTGLPSMFAISIDFTTKPSSTWLTLPIPFVVAASPPIISARATRPSIFTIQAAFRITAIELAWPAECAPHESPSLSRLRAFRASSQMSGVTIRSVGIEAMHRRLNAGISFRNTRQAS